MKQTIDIVDRLMIVWTSMTDMGNAERREAAEEVFRLRSELVSKADELEATMRELQKAEAERDEARRMIVDALYKGDVSKCDIADARGWTTLYPDETNDMEGDVE